MFKNLERALHERRLSQNSLSKLLEVSEKTIRNKLSGRCEFTWGEIKKIMIIFPEYHIEYLLYTAELEESLDLENEKLICNNE